MSLQQLIDGMTAAVEEELLEVRASRAGRRLPLRGGHLAGRSDQDWLYHFGLDQPAEMPEDVPCELEFVEGVYGGQIVSAAGFDVTIACGVELRIDLSHAQLVLDPAFLLERLLERLAALEEDDCELALALFGARAPHVRPAGCWDSGEANEYQHAAVQATLDRDVTYIWGPPGTGKTATLALAAEALALRGERVLMVASTNVAVDNAVARLAASLCGCAPTPLALPPVPDQLNSQPLKPPDGAVARLAQPLPKEPREQQGSAVAPVGLPAGLDRAGQQALRRGDGAVARLGLTLGQSRGEDEPAGLHDGTSASLGQPQRRDRAEQRALSPRDGAAAGFGQQAGRDRGEQQALSLRDGAVAPLGWQLGQNPGEGQRVRLPEGALVRLGVPQLAGLPPSVVQVPAKRAREPEDEQARLRLLRQARVVGATLSRAFLSPELGLFDAVLVDEASTARLPEVFCAASLARSRVAVLGDPKQLPPVAVSNGPAAARWLKRDVFREAGLEDDDERSVLLREQYRMDPAIAALSNELVYGGRLITPSRRDRTAQKAGAQALRLVDTSGLGARVERGEGSRLNQRHAELAVQLVEELLRPPDDDSGLADLLAWLKSAAASPDRILRRLDLFTQDLYRDHIAGAHRVANLRAKAARLRMTPVEVAAELRSIPLTAPGAPSAAPAVKPIAVIAPYRPQARLIWRLLRDARLDHLADSGTVHRFQGLERDTIIFDTVESEPERPAPFVSGGYDSEAMRLINVAITRAQSRLVVIANVGWLERMLPRNSTLRGLLRLMRCEED